jgi:pimeloyl-ACP methyl ester carboxylesterase
MAEWDPALLAALAAAGHRVVVFDYPGLGGSAALPGRVTFDRLADVAAGLVELLGAGPVDVLGWSMGGFVAQRLLVAHPGSVRCVVLAGTNPGGALAVLGPKWVQRVDSDPDAGLSAYVRTNYPRGARQRGWAFVDRVLSAQESGAYPPSRVPQRTYDAMVAAEDPWLRDDANAGQLRTVTARVLVTTGADDVVTPPANSRRLARLVPGARIRLWTGAGHSFLFQRPAAVARDVHRFLAGDPAR